MDAKIKEFLDNDAKSMTVRDRMALEIYTALLPVRSNSLSSDRHALRHETMQHVEDLAARLVQEEAG